ncbi:MAG: dihydrolipoyl dehydrogenase [Gammaproteobacteria bacterium]|nr:MAG: dihydrolipoyl dehydrogenase [Gammaproteobacteria bacterium]
MSKKYDVVVIGAGPAGYVAAIRCTQLGMKVACVDKWVTGQRHCLGGTCLNAGCIPSKALLESSELYHSTREDIQKFGIKVSAVELDLEKMMAHKDQVVRDLNQGIDGLFKSSNIEVFTGHGKLLQGNKVEVAGLDKTAPVVPEVIDAQHIILAPGSVPVDIGAAPLQDDIIVDSTGALAFKEVPKRLGIVGAGIIGLELGSVWRRLGAEVILFEAQDSFLAMADDQIAKEAQKQFTKQGLDIRLSVRVTRATVETGSDGNSVRVDYQQGSDGDVREASEVVDKLIVAVGRRPNTDRICSDDSGLILDEWGVIHVDEQCRTNLPEVYAIGDAVKGPMLAHKGSEEGIMVAEVIAGHVGKVNYATIPSVIYTHPEIAWIGSTEHHLKDLGIDYHRGVFPFAANGRARAVGNTVGMIKILADATTDRILGVHMIGPNCSEIISAAGVAMSFGASSEDIAMTMFAHPTLAEAFHEAAQAVADGAIHVARTRK